MWDIEVISWTINPINRGFQAKSEFKTTSLDQAIIHCYTVLLTEDSRVEMCWLRIADCSLPFATVRRGEFSFVKSHMPVPRIGW